MGLNIVFHLQLVLKTYLLQRQITFDVLKFLFKRNTVCGCQRFRVSPQVSGEERHRLFGLLGIDIAKLPDGGQAIVQKVGLNLGQHDGDFRLQELLFHLLGMGRLQKTFPHIVDRHGKLPANKDDNAG